MRRASVLTKHDRTRILEHGDHGQVVGCELHDGSCPAEEFPAGLETRPQAQFKAALERLTQVGWLRNPELMRELQVPGEPPIWEIKAHAGRGFRLYVVRRQTDWIATHGGPKPPDRRVPAQVRRARTILTEWES